MPSSSRTPGFNQTNGHASFSAYNTLFHHRHMISTRPARTGGNEASRILMVKCAEPALNLVNISQGAPHEHV